MTYPCDGSSQRSDSRQVSQPFSFIAGLHEGAVTSVQFHPSDTTTILTNGMDSCVKIVDMRTSAVVQTFKDPHFQTSYAWSSASFSPDGKLQHHGIALYCSWQAHLIFIPILDRQVRGVWVEFEWQYFCLGCR